jgi:hypothetical protein
MGQNPRGENFCGQFAIRRRQRICKKKDVNYDVIMTLTQGAYRVGHHKEIIRLITS